MTIFFLPYYKEVSFGGKGRDIILQRFYEGEKFRDIAATSRELISGNVSDVSRSLDEDWNFERRAQMFGYNIHD